MSLAPSADACSRIVIVGASLAGLRAAETLRAEGFRGSLTIVGDEPHLPYDRPPLSKAVLTGRISAASTALPRRRTIEGVEWRLGVAAVELDSENKRVRLADGSALPYDRVLIATGARARPWAEPSEGQLDGVFVLRGRDDAERLRERLVAGPRRVLVIGGGFTGSEVASACRELGLPVTLLERGAAPLSGALGGVIAGRAAQLQYEHGVDLRCGVTVASLEGDAHGRFRCAHLRDGSRVEADVAVVALGAVRNTEWLLGSRLAAGVNGVACDAGCRVFADNLIVTDDVFVAGDVARFPHPLYLHQFLALEHWGNAVEQAAIAAHNMICAPTERRAHLAVPTFWSSQFGVNIKSVGVPSAADTVVIAQGSFAAGRFAAVYGKDGRTVAAVTFNHGRWIEYYQRLIEKAAPFPPDMTMADCAAFGAPVPAAFPDRKAVVREATAILTGYDATERRVEWIFGSRPRSEQTPTHQG
ncbi:NAD(P)/FAD-dependent oxidoreductase [Nannocystis radixulma]|uniref:FAD/NAD(P)-binding oxidoreductase n=1 Tax=Nannocystis radixulma TaxID=2995305 RepID=A0ABT5B2T6_9BACT|nr:FAD/NAD(P)-binding oxidoreductase [Nannocystis radixulma]MDC0668412.1 FAD/NAD(P)-binding oxidoreductase [Nannocystis radixulma]